MKIENKVQLITYPNSLGGDLNGLRRVLDMHIGDVFEGVHVLPYYPSSGDRGFAPLTHKEVAQEFGTWKDIEGIAGKYTLMSDLIVNHISARSKMFQDYLTRGNQSEYAECFITTEKFSRNIMADREYTPSFLRKVENVVNFARRLDRIFHVNGVNKFAAHKIYRPRPESPFMPFEFADGSVRWLWCTFTEEQIDIDVRNSKIKKLLKEFIETLSQHGTKIFRIDAAGYAIKKKGTNSFMIPETFEFINWLGGVAHENGAAVLLEIHNHYDYQKKLAEMENVDYVYDFQISLLAIHAIYNKNVENIKKWIKIRPNNAIVVLDAHDGLPVVDLEDLLTPQEIENLTQQVLDHGGNVAVRASGANSENVDTYQVNCTYYSALNENDDAYIVARAIQFFLPGIPQVYYDGFFAGTNDMQKISRTSIGRDVLRRDYTLDMIEKAVKKPVVKRLMRLIRFRNTHEAFEGDFTLKDSSDSVLIMRWQKDKHFCEANIDLEKQSVTLTGSGELCGDIWVV